jgi:choline transport protein
MSTLGWLASVSSSVFVMTTLIEAIIDITKSNFGFANWQYTPIMLGFLLIAIAFNIWGAKALPMMETVSLYGHLLGLLVVMLPLLIMAPKNSAQQAFTEVINNGGWSDTGTACLVAQVSVLYCNLDEPNMY